MLHFFFFFNVFNVLSFFVIVIFFGLFHLYWHLYGETQNVKKGTRLTLCYKKRAQDGGLEGVISI